MSINDIGIKSNPTLRDYHLLQSEIEKLNSQVEVQKILIREKDLTVKQLKEELKKEINNEHS